MNWPAEALAAVRDFLNTGGPVLWAILFATVVLWTLLLERYWFVRIAFVRRSAAWLAAWEGRDDRTSWRARSIRDGLLSEARRQLHQGLPLIRGLIGICPLLGLLGTVTGMILVFDVISILGTGDARPMASGIWRATVPTMAGLVAALSGLVFTSHLDHLVRREAHRLETGLSS